jgi:hypothetical protein
MLWLSSTDTSGTVLQLLLVRQLCYQMVWELLGVRGRVVPAEVAALAWQLWLQVHTTQQL